MSDLETLLVGFGAWAGLFVLLGLTSDAYRALRRRRGLARAIPDYGLRARVKRLAKPTLLLVPAKIAGFSKIGGRPELPPGLSWPGGPDGALTFVAQIDIDAFHRYGGFDWLPNFGRLYLFFDAMRNGARDCGRVLYSCEFPDAAPAWPDDLPGRSRFEERRVAFMRFASLPSPDWIEDATLYTLVDWEDWPFARDLDLGDEIEHRIGGYPTEIQSSQMAIECEYLWRGLTRDYQQPVPPKLKHAARQWRLLMQIDSDPALGMEWWDAGRLYVFIRARDAKRGDFSKTVTLTQTH